MRVVFVLAIAFYTVGLWIIGLAWLLSFVLPYLLIGGAVYYLAAQEIRRRAELQRHLGIEAERQRRFNAQEFAAWQAAADERQRKSDRREKALRKFDRRNPRP